MVSSGSPPLCWSILLPSAHYRFASTVKSHCKLQGLEGTAIAQMRQIPDTMPCHSSSVAQRWVLTRPLWVLSVISSPFSCPVIVANLQALESLFSGQSTLPEHPSPRPTFFLGFVLVTDASSHSLTQGGAALLEATCPTGLVRVPSVCHLQCCLLSSLLI